MINFSTLLRSASLVLGLGSMSSIAIAQKRTPQSAPDTTDSMVIVSPQAPAIIRQTPRGDERLWYLSVTNTSGEMLRGLSLRYRVGRREQVRALLDVPSGGALDTLWLPSSLKRSPQFRLVQNGATLLWTGRLALAPTNGERYVVPRSTPIRAADLKPLTVRGTNYYPRRTPWPGLWKDATIADYEAEFKEMAALNINSLRTFYLGLDERALQRADGTFLPPLLAKINAFLEVAARHRIKVMLCLDGGGGAAKTDLLFWQRFFRSGIEPFIYDGRVLMWDLINEPGGNEGPKATPELVTWIQKMNAQLRTIAPHHLTTVGLTWQFDQLWEIGVKPDVGQYHNYSGAVGVAPPDNHTVRNVAGDLKEIVATYTGQRPLIIGEFGLYSTDGTETTEGQRQAALDKQTNVTRWVLEGAEVARIAGVMNWCAFEFTPDWMGIKEKTFGVIRPDGSLKPAGIVLRDTYARWKAQSPAPWEGSRNERAN
ncbi:MAG: hypothetical protein JWN98_842 [Abditibacteriota bacterium]|nr:hypothetical protein [Abditibacteriota bacterium]